MQNIQIVGYVYCVLSTDQFWTTASTNPLSRCPAKTPFCSEMAASKVWNHQYWLACKLNYYISVALSAPCGRSHDPVSSTKISMQTSFTTGCALMSLPFIQSLRQACWVNRRCCTWPCLLLWCLLAVSSWGCFMHCGRHCSFCLAFCPLSTFSTLCVLLLQKDAFHIRWLWSYRHHWLRLLWNLLQDSQKERWQGTVLKFNLMADPGDRKKESELW